MTALVRIAAAALAGLLAWSVPAISRTLLTQPEALALAFPAGTTVDRESHFLTAAQLRLASESAGAEIEGEIWIRYRGVGDGRLLGFAYFDTHIVRTLPETLMVVVDDADQIARVEVVRFSEPPDYLPKPAWYGQFPKRSLDDDLALGGAIRGVTGATLSARAATAAARRVLAVHLALGANGPSPPAPAAEPQPTTRPSPPNEGQK